MPPRHTNSAQKLAGNDTDTDTNINPGAAMTHQIAAVSAQEILDSRSRPTLSVAVDLVAIALDPAASEFCNENGTYQLSLDDPALTGSELIDRWEDLIGRYPIWSIEDGLDEGDDDGWKLLTTRLGDRIQLVGDDNFVTNPAIITDAIAGGIANAALIKLNQVGTVTETLAAMAVCREAGYAQMISHRSGETTDAFIADLAVATGCGQIKSGAPARGERVAKYNRLLAIERDNPGLGFGLAR
jgi:enolase